MLIERCEVLCLVLETDDSDPNSTACYSSVARSTQYGSLHRVLYFTCISWKSQGLLAATSTERN